MGNRCQKCGMVYKKMQINSRNFYDRYYMGDDVIEYFHERRRHTFRKIVDILVGIGVNSILDIGTSTGGYGEDRFE